MILEEKLADYSWFGLILRGSKELCLHVLHNKGGAASPAAFILLALVLTVVSGSFVAFLPGAHFACMPYDCASSEIHTSPKTLFELGIFVNPTKAFADEAPSDNREEVIETDIAVDPSTASTGDNTDAEVENESRAADQSVGENASASGASGSKIAVSGPSTGASDISTEFGLPADSPLFSGIEEDSSSDNASETTGSSAAGESPSDSDDQASNSNAAEGQDDQAADSSPASETDITLIPDNDWLANGNAVLPLQLPDSSFIYDTSIQELASADPYLNNQTVQVTGEAIGDNIKADLFGHNRWVTLSPVGNSATISIFMSEDSAAKIDEFGRYGVRGTILKVRGIFYLVCPEHDGVTDLHAEEVTVVKPGETVHESFNIQAFYPGIILVVIGLIMFFVFSRISERRR